MTLLGGPWVALAGGLVLWAAFLVLALIARKFEVVFGRHTRWMAMAAAPTGLVIYALLAVLGLGALKSESARNAAYWILFASGLLCAWAGRRFHLMLKSLENKDS